MRRTVLLTNDDGIFAEGIRVLRKAVDAVWESVVVAPESEQSAASHALTLNRPLRVRKIDDRTMAVDGTPADCVMLSIEGILRKKPDLVISGINNGGNLGDDVIYSGTVAGAAEATILGVPALAVSFVDPENTDFEKGALVAIRVAEAVFKYTLPRGVFLNVNIPGQWSDGPFEVTTLGNRPYREVIVEKVDPRGKPYYWIGGQADQWSGGEHCDFAAIERGNVSITPLQLNMTAVQSLQDISNWHM